MSLKTSKSEAGYTKWTHVENGKVLVRRIHRMEVQVPNGRLYVLRDDQLPDYIQTCAGEGYTGAHLAQILLNPKSLSERNFIPAVATPYPTLRDLFNAGLGVVCFLLVRFFLNLACP